MHLQASYSNQLIKHKTTKVNADNFTVRFEPL